MGEGGFPKKLGGDDVIRAVLDDDYLELTVPITEEETMRYRATLDGVQAKDLRVGDYFKIQHGKSEKVTLRTATREEAEELIPNETGVKVASREDRELTFTVTPGASERGTT